MLLFRALSLLKLANLNLFLNILISVTLYWFANIFISQEPKWHFTKWWSDALVTAVTHSHVFMCHCTVVCILYSAQSLYTLVLSRFLLCCSIPVWGGFCNLLVCTFVVWASLTTFCLFWLLHNSFVFLFQLFLPYISSQVCNTFSYLPQ